MYYVYYIFVVLARLGSVSAYGPAIRPSYGAFSEGSSTTASVSARAEWKALTLSTTNSRVAFAPNLGEAEAVTVEGERGARVDSGLDLPAGRALSTR